MQIGNRHWDRQQVDLGITNKPPGNETNIVVVGSMGAGKSYLVTSTAMQLHVRFSRSSAKQRVVFLGAEKLVSLGHLYVRRQLQVAFTRLLAPASGSAAQSQPAVPEEDVEVLASIGAIKSLAECVQFTTWASRQGFQLYFMVDGGNALDAERATVWGAPAARSEAAKCLKGMAKGHVLAQAVSAASFAARQEATPAREGTLFMHVDGGPTEAEFESCKKFYPTLSGEQERLFMEQTDRHRMKFYTGDVPLLLNSWAAATSVSDFLGSKVMLQIMRYVDSVSKDVQPADMLLLESILTGAKYDSHHTGAMSLRRLYWFDTAQRGHVISDYVRNQLAAKVFSNSTKVATSLYTAESWLDNMQVLRSTEQPNMALVGWMAELSCLAFMALDGFFFGGKTHRFMRLITFSAGNEAQAAQRLARREGAALLVPEAPNYPHVDCLVGIADGSGLTHLAGVQISVGSYADHNDSEQSFLAQPNRAKWTCSARISWGFHWVLRAGEIPKLHESTVELEEGVETRAAKKAKALHAPPSPAASSNQQLWRSAASGLSDC